MKLFSLLIEMYKISHQFSLLSKSLVCPIVQFPCCFFFWGFSNDKSLNFVDDSVTQQVQHVRNWNICVQYFGWWSHPKFNGQRKQNSQAKEVQRKHICEAMSYRKRESIFTGCGLGPSIYGMICGHEKLSASMIILAEYKLLLQTRKNSCFAM